MRRGKHEKGGPTESQFVTDFRNLVEFAFLKGYDDGRGSVVGRGPYSMDYQAAIGYRAAALERFIRDHSDDLIARLT